LKLAGWGSGKRWKKRGARGKSFMARDASEKYQSQHFQYLYKVLSLIKKMNGFILWFQLLRLLKKYQSQYGSNTKYSLQLVCHYRFNHCLCHGTGWCVALCYINTQKLPQIALLAACWSFARFFTNL
jgi:hypothetical protein